MIWADIKCFVAKNNTSFNLDDCMQLVRDRVASITREDWLSRIKHVEEIENKYFSMEPAIDAVTESLVINLGESGSSDNSDDEPHGNEAYDSDMSGVEFLEENV